MKAHWLCGLFALAAAGCLAEGRALFNGKDLTGWDGEPGWWTVEDGAITSESTPERPCKGATYLSWTEGRPVDFELTAEFKLSEKGNSGIQIRSQTRPKWDTFGYQADMTGDGGLAGFVYHHKGGLIAGRGEEVSIGADGKRVAKPLGDPKELLKAYKQGDWNLYRIVCRGPLIELYLNGVLMSRFTEAASDAPRDGLIALQMHPGPPMKVQFKNLTLTEFNDEKK
ncbi:MAG: DUF1080 domain-containing protein [Verrucomicrobiota bacterium]|jgi:hypothetical protein|nr:DUF1080 domain-containing protein [Verrucomicrobiota bacterium]